MLRQILVAVDFSVCSRCAARHAFEVARAIGGTVTLLHVLEDQESGLPNSGAAHTLLRQLSLLARRPPNCLIVPASSGANGRKHAVAQIIVAAADQLGAELIVIGLHGQGSMTAGALGQVMQQVLLNAGVPVQVVPCRSNRPSLERWSGARAGGGVL